MSTEAKRARLAIGAIAALAVLTAAAPQGARGTGTGDVAAFHAKEGYWDGKLGRKGSKHRDSPEVQLITRRDDYMLGLLATILCPPDRRPVQVDLHLSRNCPYGVDCGPYGIGFSYEFSFRDRRSIRGEWKLDKTRFPGCKIRKGERRMRATWQANPRLSVTPSTVARGETVTAKGRGYLPREQVWVVGNSPLFSIGAPFRADRHGAFERRAQIHPNQYPGNYPDVYLFQRSCLTICWVKGSTSMTVLP
jgi:hypothetical protein